MAKKKTNQDAYDPTAARPEEGAMEKSVRVSGLYEDWFLDYASYVILERAVPHVSDGLKPVQRRILHALREMEDGRFHKVANAIGQTMQYHPHGDAAIGDALVNLGQKDLLIDCQGNWGDVRTGDGPAAPRYIEAKLSKFALEVLFNPKTTDWQLSYDGRKKEPVTLPVKFPLLLAQGVEGIAVGLATKILPHNFIELCQGAIKVLEGKPTKLLPDFPTGGIADVSDYQRGQRGGKVRVRASIEIAEKRVLAIRDVPYGITTASLIDSIIKANEKGKIKIKSVVDNTAAEVEILVELAPDASPEVTIDALYAFTNCEVSISPNACVIIDDKPHFLTVDEILRVCAEQTRELLRRELEIRQHELEEKWHFASLEKIFIENRIYRDIEECETWEAVIEAIDRGLDPFKPSLNRAVTEEDIVRLTEIRIKRISKYDSFKADEHLLQLERELEEVRHHLAHLTAYAVAWYQGLIDRYGKGRERKTRLQNFETIQAVAVAAANAKLYVNRKDGFIGTGLKKDEYLEECSDLDDVVVIRKDGMLMVTRVADKKYVGADVVHAGVWRKGDDRTTYNLIYADLDEGRNYAKRFQVTAITRDKEYPLGKGGKLKVLYLTANPNGESEVVHVQLSPNCRAHKKQFDFDFSELEVKNRGAKGNIVSKYPIRKITQKEVGASTLGGMAIWLDETVGRLNTEERGRLLGEFDTGDQILVWYKDGHYGLTGFELSHRYEMDKIHRVERFDPDRVWTAVHQDGASKTWYVKRFRLEGGVSGRTYPVINEAPGSRLGLVTDAEAPVVRYTERDGSARVERTVRLDEFIDVKGWKAQGNKLTDRGVAGKFHLVEEEGAADAVGAGDAPSPEALSSGQTLEWDLEKGTRQAGKASPGAKRGRKPKADEDQGSLF